MITDEQIEEAILLSSPIYGTEESVKAIRLLLYEVANGPDGPMVFETDRFTAPVLQSTDAT